MMQREQNKHKEAEGRKQEEEKENLRKCKATSTQPIWFFEKINIIDKPQERLTKKKERFQINKK